MSDAVGDRAAGWVRLACVVGTLAVAAGVILWLQPAAEFALDDFALDENARTVRGATPEGPYHCSTVTDGAACVAAAQQRALPQAALWLGNSQVHAVMQWAEGQENAPPELFRALRPTGWEVSTFSMPNGSAQEHYVMFEWLRQHLPIRAVVVALCYDDTREAGLRPGIARALAEPAVRAALAQTDFGRTLLARESASVTEDGDLAGLNETVQERAEVALVDLLDAHWMLWRLRPKSRAEVFIRLFRLRNRLLGITAQSKRKKIASQYADNLAGLDALLQQAKAHGVPAIAYIVPIRGDEALPYDMAEYEGFKADAERLAKTHGAVFANLEGLVPPEHWGAKRSTRVAGETEIDFMHFREPGHRLLAAELLRLLRAHAVGIDR